LHRPKGLIDAIIFVLMEEKPRYGYEIIKKVEEISGGHWQPGQGTVYGALDRMEDDGLIESVEFEEEKEGETRQYFCLTDQGREKLEEVRRKKEEEDFRPAERILGLLHVFRFLAGEDDFIDLLSRMEKEFEEYFTKEEEKL